jgi:hypothetical protein
MTRKHSMFAKYYLLKQNESFFLKTLLYYAFDAVYNEFVSVLKI